MNKYTVNTATRSVRNKQRRLNSGAGNRETNNNHLRHHPALDYSDFTVGPRYTFRQGALHSVRLSRTFLRQTVRLRP